LIVCAFILQVCRYATGRQDRLFTHMRSHGEMFCLYCDYSTAQVDTYRAHMQSCSAAESRDVSAWNESGDAPGQFSEQEQTCRLCNVVFSFRADLEAHINGVHVETIIDTRIDRLSGLSNDPIDGNASTDVRSRYACRTCGEVADDEETIHEHVMSHAPESYECTVVECDFRATYARTLELHMKYYHNTEASHQNQAMDRSVSPSWKSAALNSPASTPSKNYNPSGTQTPKSSELLSSGSVLTGLMSSNTPSIGQFLCPVCKERAPFKYRRSFEKHISQHTVNVHVCPMCVESFLAMDELRTHMIFTHGANVLK